MPTVTELWNRSADVDERGRYTFSRRFRVLAENRKVGHKAILAAVGASPWNITIGRPWQLGSPGDPFYETENVYCARISAECSSEEDGTAWYVTATWEPANPDLLGPSAISDNPANNPIRVEWGQWSETFPVWRHIDGGVLTNTAGDRFSEPVEADRYFPLLRINRFERTFDQALAASYRNTVNIDEWEVAGYTVPARSAKCVSITATREYHQNMGSFWDVSYEFALKVIEPELDITGDVTNQGWDVYEANVGYRYKATDGNVCLVSDKNGVPVEQPVPLDKFGNPLPLPLSPTTPLPMRSFAILEAKDLTEFGFPTTA